MSRVRTFRIALLVGVGSAICQSVSGNLITPTDVTASTCDPAWPAIGLIQGHGLKNDDNTVDVPHIEAAPGNAWVTPHKDDNTNYYDWSNEAPVLTFQLGAVYSLDGIAIWNYSPPVGDNGRPTKTASNCAKFIALKFDVPGQDSTCYTPPDTLVKGRPDEWAQIITFPHSFQANAVELTITDNWHDAIGCGDRVGLSEVKFLAPEPSSLLLTAIGLFGLVCLVGRRSAGRHECLPRPSIELRQTASTRGT